MAPKVSVIIPTYNSARFVADAIDSVLVQDYPNKEVIVVDDGSTDNTAELIANYDQQVKLIRQENAGPAAARNNGVRASTGELVAFLDSDDFWLPGKLVAQVAYLEHHPDTALVFHDWDVSMSETEKDKTLRADIKRLRHRHTKPDLATCMDGWLYNELLFDSIMTTISVMMRRSLFDQLGGFDESLPQGQDYDMWLRASRETRIAKLCDKLAVISKRQGSISTTLRPVNYRARILERTLDRWGGKGPDGRITPEWQTNHSLMTYWLEFGYLHAFRGGDRDVAMRAFLQAMKYEPWQLKIWLNLARTFATRFILGSEGASRKRS